MKKIFILAAACFLAISANAQIVSSSSNTYIKTRDNGFTALWLSYLPTTLKESGDGYSSSESGYNTFALGFTHATPLSEVPVLVEYGAFAEYTTKTEKEHGGTGTMHLIGAKVPLSVMYGYTVSENVILYPYAGLFARLYVIGKETFKFEDESETYDLFNNDDGDNMKRFGLGYQLGVKARISGFFVGLGYEDMITSLIPDYTAKFNMINLSVGIPF